MITGLLTACGDDDDRAQTVETPAPATVTTSPTASTSIGETVGVATTESSGSSLESDVSETTMPGTTASSPPATASQDLSQYLLTLDDLPSGWSPSPEESDEDESSTTTDPPECSDIGEEEVEDAEGAVNEASVEFQQSTFGPFVSNGIIAYESSGEAEQAFDTIIDGINTCQTFTETDESGNETTYTFAPLSMDDYGDQTFATVLRGTSPFGPFEANFVFVRDGPYLAFVLTAGFGAAPPIDISELVATAVDRLP